MTNENEEAITILKREFSECKDTISVYARKRKKAFDMAIKALEQMDVLDKVRAEIEQNAYPIVHGVNNHEKGMTLYGILQVIDKYKGESEESICINH